MNNRNTKKRKTNKVIPTDNIRRPKNNRNTKNKKTNKDIFMKNIRRSLKTKS